MLWYACRHSATPRFLKIAAALLALYILSPIDLIPDWVPVLGWIDDVTLAAFGIPALLTLVPEPVRQQARAETERWLSRWKLRFGRP
jgi:uncharacterized membrane protein YkvA (DUF1232 family)